jgi:protein transport protein SEC24
VSIDEDLKDSREVSFQAALLYTSSKGERRIRVHTLCIPTSANLQEIIQVSVASFVFCIPIQGTHQC